MEPKIGAFCSTNKVNAHGFSWSNGLIKVYFGKIGRIQVKVYPQTYMEPKIGAFCYTNEVIAHGFSWSNGLIKVLSLSKYLKLFFDSYKCKYTLKLIWIQKLVHFAPLMKSMPMYLDGRWAYKSTMFFKVHKVFFGKIGRIQVKVYP